MRYKKSTENLIVFQNKFYDEVSGTPTAPVVTQNYEIVQGADSYYLSTFEINAHKQYCDFEITFCLSNKMQVSTDQISEILSKNDCYLSFSGDIHTLNSPSVTRFLTYAFNVKKDSPIFELFQKVKSRFFPIHERKLTAPVLCSVLTGLIKEFYNMDSAETIYALDEMTTDLLVRLSRFGKEDVESDLFDAKELFARILNFVDENFLVIQSLDEIATRFGYSYNYIYKLFIKFNKTTPMSYLNAKKMDFAKEYLKSHSVTQTSDLLSYTSPYNFSRAYKKYFGSSPRKE